MTPVSQQEQKQKTQKIGTRFTLSNTILFVLIAASMFFCSLFVVNNIADTVSKDYAELHSARANGILNSYLSREIALMTNAAESEAITEWFSDEADEEKKQAAYIELSSTLEILNSGNIHFGIEKDRNEYNIDEGDSYEKLIPAATLSPDRADDQWYFECLNSSYAYLLNVDIDKLNDHKRVWLNYKVTNDGEVLGSLTTGLLFDQVLEELFSEYDDKTVRSLVIDEKGIIQMDSSLEGEENLLIYENEVSINEVLDDPAFKQESEKYLSNVSGLFDGTKQIEIIELQSGNYRYASLSPIRETTWSVVSFYDSSALFNFQTLWPLIVVIIGLFVLYVIVTNLLNRRILLKPINKLADSLSVTTPAAIKEGIVVAGQERNDEFGTLARTVQNMIDRLNEYNAQLIDATKRAEAASESKSTFLASMSHEIRTPINAIVGMTYIGKKADDPAQKDECLEQIEVASSHLLGVINDILDISKIEADKFELSFDWFDLRKTLQNVIDVMLFRMVEKNIEFELDYDQDLPDEIMGDDQRFTQVVANLLSNASKFTPEGGSIGLKARLVSKDAKNYAMRIDVIDNGIGIPEDDQKRLFHSFEQADKSTSRKYGGTGLGLSISKHIVESVEGEIGVDSTPGKGSTFYFAFTAEGRRSSSRSENENSDTQKRVRKDASNIDCFRGKKILVAEDMKVNRVILEKLLEETGIEIDFAENGKEAVGKFVEKPDEYQLIVMDIQMPEMDGYEATGIIRSSGTTWAKEIPILAMTANAFREDVEKSLECGMNDHIAKPVDYDLLMEKLTSYLCSGRRP